jgi:integrase
MPARKKRPITVAVLGPDAAGRYCAFLTVGVKPNGKPDRRKRSGKTVAEVEEKIRQLEDQRGADGVGAAGRVPTVEAWVGHWLINIIKPRRKHKTFTSYRTAITQYIVPYLGAHRLDKLGPEHVEYMYAEMARRGLAASAPLAYRTLRAAINVAMKRDDRIRRNAATIAGSPAGDDDEAEIEPLTIAEAQHVVEVADRQRNGARWAIAVALGMRQGEVLGLRWSDVDLDEATVRVRRKAYRKAWEHGCRDPRACAARKCRTEPCRPPYEHGCGGTCRFKSDWRCPERRVARRCTAHRRDECPKPCAPDCTGHARACPKRRDGGIVYDDPKSRAGKRTISLPAELVEALRRHRSRQRRERMAARNKWVDNDLVFAGPLGDPVDARKDWQDWQDLLGAAGVTRRGTHAGRHTAATMLLVMGVDAAVVMSIMGWSERSMLNHYQHVVRELRDDAAKRMGTLLWNSAGSASGSNPGLIERS